MCLPCASPRVRGQGPTREQARKGGREGGRARRRVSPPPLLPSPRPFPRAPTSSGTSLGLTGWSCCRSRRTCSSEAQEHVLLTRVLTSNNHKQQPQATNTKGLDAQVFLVNQQSSRCVGCFLRSGLNLEAVSTFSRCGLSAPQQVDAEEELPRSLGGCAQVGTVLPNPTPYIELPKPYTLHPTSIRPKRSTIVPRVSV